MIVFLAGLVLFLGIHSVSIVAPGWRKAQAAQRGEGSWNASSKAAGTGGAGCA